MRALCRDCLTDGEDGAAGPRARCPHCRSPRLIRHPERDSLHVAHIDCDAFYAAIEKRDDPSLVGRPVIVGGGKRGVVATACYVARTFGVRSAMPMFKALAACPEAIVIKPDMAKYVKVGREIRRLMLELTPLVEPISIDEAFLDLSGTEALHRASPAVTLARFAARVEREIGITVSVGLSYAKFLAKIASDMNKPRGFSVLGRGEAVGYLAGRPVGLLPGVGQAAARRLAEAGITRIGQLASLPDEVLFRSLGNDARRLQRLARGEDNRKVSPEREAKSVSSETTFEEDIVSVEVLEPILWRMAERTAARLRKSDLAGRTVTLKLKSADFRIITRARRLNEPTQLAKRLFEAARPLLAAEANGRAWRLLGIGASDLSPGSEADRGDLADLDTRRDVAVERAVESLRERFGAGTIVKGFGLGRSGSGLGSGSGPGRPGSISRRDRPR